MYYMNRPQYNRAADCPKLVTVTWNAGTIKENYGEQNFNKKQKKKKQLY